MKLTIPLFAFLILMIAPIASASLRTKEFTYKQGDTELQGFIAWDDSWTGKRPGVLVVHEWWGHNAHARNQAIRLTKAGYVGLALDMYGKGKVAQHPEDAQAFMQEATKDLAVVQARFASALDALKADSHVDPERIAAIGYCFGGAVALGMARSGADLDAVVSFHGSLGTEHPAQPGAVKARVLVLTGAADPLIPPEQVAAFDTEMKSAGANYRIVAYPGVKHSFTNPEAGKRAMEQLKYDKGADKKSWTEMVTLFKEIWPAM